MNLIHYSFDSFTNRLTAYSSQTLLAEGTLEDGAVFRTLQGVIVVVHSPDLFKTHLRQGATLLGYLPPPE